MSRYRLKITGLEIQQALSVDDVFQKINAWAQRTGARSVTSGEIRMHHLFDLDCNVYTAHFNSSAWTGRD